LQIVRRCLAPARGQSQKRPVRVAVHEAAQQGKETVAEILVALAVRQDDSPRDDLAAGVVLALLAAQARLLQCDLFSQLLLLLLKPREPIRPLVPLSSVISECLPCFPLSPSRVTGYRQSVVLYPSPIPGKGQPPARTQEPRRGLPLA